MIGTHLERKHGPAVEAKVGAISLDLKALSEDGTFEGYGSTFGNVDQGGDIVMAGAFRRTLKERPRVKMLRDHDTRKIVGKWLDIREDERGLKVKGRLFAKADDHNPLAMETLALMREGELDALSIGYRTVKSLWDDSKETRQLIDVDLWEVSVVTFAMNEMATVDDVKSEALSIRDCERILREGGAPAEFAKLVAIHGFDGATKRLGAHREGGPGESLAEMIRSTVTQMKETAQ